MPGLVCLVSVPLILYVLFPPEVKDTPDAPAKARCGPGGFVVLCVLIAVAAWCSTGNKAELLLVSLTRVVLACSNLMLQV